MFDILCNKAEYIDVILRRFFAEFPVNFAVFIFRYNSDNGAHGGSFLWAQMKLPFRLFPFYR